MFAIASDPSRLLAWPVGLAPSRLADALGAMDPLLRMALYSGVCAILVSLVLVGAVLVLRIRLLGRLRRERRFVAVWRPLMVQSIDGAPGALPPLAAADHGAFLRLWNHYSESLLGPAHEHLNRLATAAGMDEVARSMLLGGSLGERLLAVVTLGHLGDRAHWHKMRALAESESPVLSIAAARAMLRIDPAPVLPWFIPLAADRADWSLARVAAMLEEAGANRVTPILASVLAAACDARADGERLSRLLRLTEVAHAGEVAQSVRRILATTADPRVIADGLSALRDPRDAEHARRYAAHEAWVVRVAAAKALGRLGTRDDQQLLAGMLGDPNWWVRHRAAEALAALPFVAQDELVRLRNATSDTNAARALDQVIAERS